ncbi:MAG: cold-shock protein [Gorillibacterium sp.]|nr:cold-shock protein [Gorillibacterium sp.]
MFSRKKSLEEIPEENTDVWSCQNPECKGWMRANFAFDTIPNCSLCQSPMIKGNKQLPPIANFSNDWKSNKKDERTII